MKEAVRRRLAIAVLVAILLLLPQLQRLVTAPYDSWTHLFFAAHYLEEWFGSTVSGWYLGFPVTSYPPLVHQLLALLSVPFTLGGLDRPQALMASYTVLAFVFTCLYPLAVYSFGTVVVSERAASYGAIAAAVFSGWWALLLGFGQLPTVVASVVALFGASALYTTLRTGDTRFMVLTALVTALVPMMHHFTTVALLAGTYLTAVGSYVLDARSGPYATASVGTTVFRVVRRAVPVGIASVAIASVALLPFIEFLLTGPNQPVIPHASRQSWFEGAIWSRAQFPFTLFSGGLFLCLVPVCGAVALKRRQTKALMVTGIAALFGLLSLGFTTPLPHLLYPTIADNLTYFRFGAWGGFLLLPVVGFVIATTFDGRLELTSNLRWPDRRELILVFVLFILVTQVLVASQMTSLGAASPDRRAEAQQIGEFLEVDEHWKWRYLTLGMTQELGLIGIEAPRARTIDGNYNTGRLAERVPVLANSGVAQLSNAKYAENGREILGTYLANHREYGIKFVFSADQTYDSQLRANGFEVLYEWDWLDVRAWYDPKTPLPGTSPGPIPQRLGWAVYLWGIVPLISLLALLGATKWAVF